MKEILRRVHKRAALRKGTEEMPLRVCTKEMHERNTPKSHKKSARKRCTGGSIAPHEGYSGYARKRCMKETHKNTQGNAQKRCTGGHIPLTSEKKHQASSRDADSSIVSIALQIDR